MKAPRELTEETKATFQLREEKQYWFNRAVAADQEAKDCAKRLELTLTIEEELRDAVNDMKLRLELVTKLHRAMNETGWRCSWNLGNITAEGLEALLKEALAYTPPVHYSNVTRNPNIAEPANSANRDTWRAHAVALSHELKRIAPAVNWSKVPGGKRS